MHLSKLLGGPVRIGILVGPLLRATLDIHSQTKSVAGDGTHGHDPMMTMPDNAYLSLPSLPPTQVELGRRWRWQCASL